jgi:hypothetical protein
MYCRFCGATLPDDSTFCQKCGKSLAATAAPSSKDASAAAPAMAPIPKSVPQPAGKASQNAILAGMVLLIVVFGGIWWIANNRGTSSASDGASTSPGFHQQTSPVPTPQLHRVRIGTGALTVNASSSAYFTLAVPAGANNVRLQGRFSATGGSGNDVKVYLLSEDQYTNWQNGHSTPTFYNSDKVTVSDVNVTLPNDAGTYYLVFDNRFSLFSPKAVEEQLTLTYYQ